MINTNPERTIKYLWYAIAAVGVIIGVGLCLLVIL